MVNALHEAEKLGFDTVQVFTKNQQQWKSKPLDPAMVAEWRREVARLGWEERTVSHASYLINLASFNDDLWKKSVDLMTEEIERCETLGIPFLVHHPGSFVGWDVESGLGRIGTAYKELFRRTRGYRTVSCLEGTVGCGSLIGGPFEHLGRLRAMISEAAGSPERVGFCLDTCHMHAFGYDLSSRDAARGVLAEFDRVCGLSALRVMHINDSKGKTGSRLDRHTHIGQGTIGGRSMKRSGFAEVVNHPRLASVPKILETPKDDKKTGVPWDLANLRRLKALIEPVPARSRGRRVGRMLRREESTAR
jgi:deoxyribonuclease-4